MQVSLTKFLLLISWVLFLVGCGAPKQLQPLSKGQVVTLSKDNFKPIFKDNFKSFLFKTTMAYGDKFEQGGMLMLKQLSEGNYRTVFMTKFGMTLFDFEFGKNGFVVHKVLKEMNKKVFLKIIEEDIEMLLARDLLGQKATFFEQDNPLKKQRIIKTTLNQKTHFLVQNQHQQLTEIHKKRAVSISLSNYVTGIPRAINIQHHNIPLSMKLLLLKH
ncbi:hypothetical protein [Aureispira anguillae]|uniref:Lipoprotein n=1 Tax=Aureispira anguillae TaxID=2864201 RepID=A0A916DX95_9BACT|nr:hypothetical protein [Aureispira anguillae]BDS15642.1 hypothetical protein AsAng_0064260 [Aureispira anguillae]